MWTGRPGRWRGRVDTRHPSFMQWRVGALRPGAEDIAWTDYGHEPDWSSARRVALDALRELAKREGRQEYRIEVGDVEGASWPGVDGDGRLDLSIIEDVVPLTR